MKISPIGSFNHNKGYNRPSKQKNEISFQKAYLCDNFVRILKDRNIPLSDYAFLEILDTKDFSKKVLQEYVSYLKKSFDKYMRQSSENYLEKDDRFDKLSRKTGMHSNQLARPMVEHKQTQQIRNTFNNELDDNVKTIFGNEEDKLDFDFYIDRHECYDGEISATDLFADLKLPGVYWRRLHRLNYDDEENNETVMKRMVEHITEPAFDFRYIGGRGQQDEFTCLGNFCGKETDPLLMKLDRKFEELSKKCLSQYQEQLPSIATDAMEAFVNGSLRLPGFIVNKGDEMYIIKDYYNPLA